MKNIIKALVPDSIKQDYRDRQQLKAVKETFLGHLKPTDVFVVGHPKSGNTWLAYMLGIVLLGDRHQEVTMSSISKFIPTIHTRDELIGEINPQTSPRIYRNEGPVLADYYPKTIYLIRDPRAVLLSYYHHWLHADVQDHGTLELFVEEMLTHGCIKQWEAWLTRWDVQVDDWLAREKRQSVKIVRYEDLLDDRERVFREIVEFAGIDCTEESFSRAVDRGDFKKMRDDEKQHGAESYPGQNGSKGFFIRKGTRDSWKDEMSDTVSTMIEKKFHATMKAVNYL